MITPQQAKAIFPNITTTQIADLNNCLATFNINTKARINHFLSQCGHESGGLKWVKEIADGSAYEGRKDLGNTQPGDGARFKGGGVIQLTGRANYQAFANYAKDPRVMEGVNYVSVKYPFTSAGFWWFRNGMNTLCDRGASVKEVTKRVNGGYNGLGDRLQWYAKINKILVGDIPKKTGKEAYYRLIKPTNPPMVGNDVSEWQKQINYFGYNLIVDGVYGAKSQDACRDLQKKRSLEVDGVIGPDTWRESFERS